MREELASLQAERVSQAQEEKAKAEAERQKAALRLAMLEKLASEETVTSGSSRWLALVPFGVGQFQNGQTALGWTFLATESLLVAGQRRGPVVTLYNENQMNDAVASGSTTAGPGYHSRAQGTRTWRATLRGGFRARGPCRDRPRAGHVRARAHRGAAVPPARRRCSLSFPPSDPAGGPRREGGARGECSVRASAASERARGRRRARSAARPEEAPPRSPLGPAPREPRRTSRMTLALVWASSRAADGRARRSRSPAASCRSASPTPASASSTPSSRTSRDATLRWVARRARLVVGAGARAAGARPRAQRARRAPRHRHQRHHPREGARPRAAPLRGPRVLRQADARPARGVVAAHRARHRELRPRPERHHARRLRRRCSCASAAWAVLALCAGDGARDGRRDALLEARLPPPQLALARVAAAHLPRVRARERRARQGGEALRPRAAAPRTATRRSARSSTSEDRQLAVQRATWTQVLSLVGTGAVLRRLRGDGAAGGRRASSRSAT